ncbi:DUF4064 domain-containing protein [Sporosarcina sp. HYO08]|uniref:DUF4064 domain-containing protein n=1 Tax=Sporosarcina sp. HYO08 TaxID=1759557 RepID=UPI000798DA85|nr:DUF4064 domain-containing protein [Sporosarcina sp. HYO08]KXH80932.1 hypothetical protein AU377_09370 [Sporosarcina sp. HYO08]
MKRTAERILSIIGTVFTGISVVLGIAFMSFINVVKSDSMMMQDFEKEMLAIDPTMTPEDLEVFTSVMGFMGGIMWLLIIGLVISFILSILGIVKVWNNSNPKLAGILFIISGVLGGILSLASILLYIAAILCFVRKAPIAEDSHFLNDQYDDTMRPL